MQEIELSDLIVSLRKELLSAQKVGRDQQIQFGIENIDLEVEFVTSIEGEGGGNIKFWVCNAETKAKFVNSEVHRLKLTLIPTDDGKPLKVGRRGRK